MTDIDIRLADLSERQSLRALQELSLRTLGAAYYDEDVIETFIAHIGTMDETLIEDRTYFAAFVNGALAGCGGWSTRMPGYVQYMPSEALPGARKPVTVRSVFVHPDFSRRGVGRRIMAAIEAGIAAANFSKAALAATLSGIPFYRQLGYRGGAPVVLRLPGERLFLGTAMEKRIGRSTHETRAA